MPMAVSPEYKERLKEFVENGIKRHGGQNRFASHTERLLARYGMDGFRSAQLGRWKAGQVKEDLADDTLARLGLLKGFSRSPEEAKHAAYRWLHGLAFEQGDHGVAGSGSARALSLLERVETEPLPVEELRSIAIAAINRLAELAPETIEEQPKEGKMPVPNPFSYLVEGWLTRNEMTLDTLAQTLSVSPERLKDILDGHPISRKECERIAPYFDLSVDTLIAWGACTGALVE